MAGFIDWQLDLTEMYNDLAAVNDKIQNMEKNATAAFHKVLGIVRSGWMMVQGVVRATGGAVSMTTRLAVSAGLGAIQVLGPILSAWLTEAVITWDFAKVMMVISGIAEVATATAALIAYETEQRDLALQLRGLNFMFSSMSMMTTQIGKAW